MTTLSPKFWILKWFWFLVLRPRKIMNFSKRQGRCLDRYGELRNVAPSDTGNEGLPLRASHLLGPVL